MNWKFWEKDSGLSDDPFAGLDDLDGGSSSNDALSESFSPPPQQEPQFSPPMSQQVPAQQSGGSEGGRDLHGELVLSKLDAIRNQLESMSARIERLEESSKRVAQQQEAASEERKRGPWYAQR